MIDSTRGEIVPDFATKDGTKRYFLRLAQAGIKIPQTSLLHDLTVSKVGFGTYRVNEFDSDHRAALRQALGHGCNLIDTSTNYANGGAEKLIGEILTELFSENKLRRDEVTVITKVGYIQGDVLKEGQNRKSRDGLWPEVAQVSSEAWHCIHPEFIREQITASLRRLRLNCLDGVLIHNPEYFLKSNQSRDEYYKRIDKALRHLEQEVGEKRIRFYGISSNTFPETESKSDFTSLKRILEIVANIGKSNHFYVIQMPMNLFESGAALTPNNDRKTVLQLALENNLAVLTNRPFNSFSRDRLVRLTSFSCPDPVDCKGEYHQVLSEALELERNSPQHLRQHEGLRWAHVIRDHFGDMDDLLAWKAYLTSKIHPTVRTGLGRVPRDQVTWREEYETVLGRLFKAVTNNLECLAQEKSLALQGQLKTACPELASSNTLSQALLRVYESVPAVTSVLVGMRSAEYVQDCLEVGPLLTPEKAVEVLDRFQKHKN